MGTLIMTKAIEKMIKQAKNVERITKHNDNHTITIQKQIHSCVKYGEGKSTTNTYKCRRIFLEKDCKYFIVMTRHGFIEFVKSHEHSKKSLDLIDDGLCPKSFNGSYSTLNGQVYLRCNSDLHTVFKGGMQTLRLLIEVELNSVIYLIDGKPVTNEDFLYNHKFYPEYELVRNAIDYDYEVVDKYDPDIHCKALLNASYTETYITSIQENDRFLALSIGQLFSLPYKINEDGFFPTVRFKLEDLPVTGCNQYPFKYSFIPYENSYGIICDFLGKLRNNTILGNLYYKKKTKPREPDEHPSESSGPTTTTEVVDSWESLAKPSINFYEDVMKPQEDSKLPSSDPGKVYWCDLPVSSEDEKQVKDLQDKLGLTSSFKKETKRGKKTRKVHISDIKFTKDELKDKLSVQEDVGPDKSRSSTLWRLQNKEKHRKLDREKERKNSTSPATKLSSTLQPHSLDKKDTLDTVYEDKDQSVPVKHKKKIIFLSLSPDSTSDNHNSDTAFSKETRSSSSTL